MKLTLVLSILAASLSSADAQTHTYDAIGRLIWSTQSCGAATSFSYDPNGNLQSVTNVLPGQDTDGDGLPDSFEIHYTGSITAADAGGDGDGDGLINLLEFAFARDPQKPDANALTPVSIEPPVGANRYLTLRYLRPKQGTALLTYQAEVSYDLQPGGWSSAPADVELVSVTAQSGGTELVTVRAKTAVGTAGKAFLRVRVTKLP